MGARGETLAKQFEAKAAEATGVIEKLSDADWKKVTSAEKWPVGGGGHPLAGSPQLIGGGAADGKKVTSAEKWPVGVTAHHIAVSHELIGGLVKSVASGQAGPPIKMDDI